MKSTSFRGYFQSLLTERCVAERRDKREKRGLGLCKGYGRVRLEWR